MPDTLKYFCVSQTIANYLQKYIIYRKRKIFFSESGRAVDLVPILEKHNKETYLLPISESVEDTKARCWMHTTSPIPRCPCIAQ